MVRKSGRLDLHHYQKCQTLATSFDKELEPEIPTRRKVSNVEAAQSNLKYWIKKGKPIQVNPKIQNFVKATTTDFDKLPTKIKDKIKEGSLTIYDIKRSCCNCY